LFFSLIFCDEMANRVDLDGRPIKPMTICMIGAGGFIGSHLCEKLLNETSHKILALDVYNDKIKHLLEPNSSLWADRIQFHRINIKQDSRLEGLIKMADLTINLAAICTPADYNTRPLDTIYSNFIDALPVVKYCSENNKRLIHFSTCEVYGKTIGSYLPKDSPLRQVCSGFRFLFFNLFFFQNLNYPFYFECLHFDLTSDLM
jgi:UDP-apiose/xylose synthase